MSNVAPRLHYYPFLEISRKNLGIRVEVFDTFGNNIEMTGASGELVVTGPHPTVPVCFWGDHTGEKFKNTYFNHFSGKSFC